MEKYVKGVNNELFTTVQRKQGRKMKPYALIATGKPAEAKRCQQTLLKLGYQVQVVSTGARAQVQLAFTTPDLIVLDMDLPDMPGEVVLRQINAQRRMDATALILLADWPVSIDEEDRKAPSHTVTYPINAEKLAAFAADLVSPSP